jgi:hypothetical protein
VHEVPGPERALLALDDQQGLARQHEEVLLVDLPVVHRHRLPGTEHLEVDPDLGELRLVVERAQGAASRALVPAGIAGVYDEPALARRDQAVLRLDHPGGVHQPI